MIRKYMYALLAAVFALAGKVAAATPTPLPTFDMSSTNTFIALPAWDFEHMLPALMSVITRHLGDNGLAIVYATFVIVILVGMAARTGEILIPAIVLMILGGTVMWGTFMPQEYSIYVIIGFGVMLVAGTLYSLYTTKRKG